MGQKITAASWGLFTEALDVRAPLFHVPEVNTVHVRLTAGDLHGYGYAYCWHKRSGEALMKLGALMSPKLIGTEITDWPDVSRAVQREFVNFLGTQGMAAFVLSALDMAMWDLAMKAAGISLQSARNRPDRPAAAYLSLDLWPNVDPAECRRLAEGFVKRGFRGVKMWISAQDLDRERARVSAVRDALGPERALHIDANQVLSPRQALDFAERVADLKPEWLEDPVSKDDLDGLRWLAERSPVPIATGENAYGVAGLKQIIDAAPIHTALIDLQRIGGITGWTAAEGLCAIHGIRATTHVYHHVGARLLAGCTPSSGLVEYSPWFDGPFGPTSLTEGGISPNPAPGATCDPNDGISWVEI